MSDHANIWALMVFGTGQVQPLVLQYKGRDHAIRDKNLLTSRLPERVTVTDDYGRELSMHPADAMMVMIQDVDMANEGNVLAGVKSGVSQAVTQVQTQEGIEKAPEMKSAIARSKLIGNMGGGNGPFRG